jgi:hypothetical protein
MISDALKSQISDVQLPQLLFYQPLSIRNLPSLPLLPLAYRTWANVPFFVRRIVRINVPVAFLELLLGFVPAQGTLAGPPRFGIDPRSKGALSKICVNAVLLLLDLLFELLLVPHVDSVQKAGAAMDHITFVVTNDRLEGAFHIDFVFILVVLFYQILLRFASLVVQILPHRLTRQSRVECVLRWRTLKCWSMCIPLCLLG